MNTKPAHGNANFELFTIPQNRPFVKRRRGFCFKLVIFNSVLQNQSMVISSRSERSLNLAKRTYHGVEISPPNAFGVEMTVLCFSAFEKGAEGFDEIAADGAVFLEPQTAAVVAEASLTFP